MYAEYLVDESVVVPGEKSVPSIGENYEKSTQHQVTAILNGAPQPEVDVVDNITFLAWETEEDLNEYSRIDEKARADAQERSAAKVIIPTKTTDITKIKGWRNKVFGSPISGKFINDCNRFNTKPSRENEHPGNHNDFVQKNFIDKTKIDLKSSGNYSPVTSSPLTVSITPKNDRQAKRIYRQNLPHMLSMFGEEESFEYEKTKSPKTTPRAKKSRIIFEESEVTIFDSCQLDCSEEVIELAFRELTRWAEDEIQKRKKEINPSFVMDDQYLRYALSGMEDVTEKRCDTSKTLDVLSAVGLTPSPHANEVGDTTVHNTVVDDKNLERDVDVTKIISRHSKRDIRLPARYHQSGLLVGSQWVIPEIDSPTKIGRKRLLQEQRRLIMKQKNVSLGLKHDVEKPQPNHASQRIVHHNINSEFVAEKRKLDQRPNSLLLSNSNKRFRRNPTDYSVQLKLHKQRLIQLAQMRRQEKERKEAMRRAANGVRGQNNSSRGIVETVMQKLQHLGERSDSSVDEELKNEVVELERNSNAGEMTSLHLRRLAMSKEAKMMELKELYRLLYYENKPERRFFYSQKGIKPRVNKKEVVDEGVQIIQKLLKREQQLEYIKKLLAMWNKKLEICVKVAEKSARGDSKMSSTPEHVTSVVSDVLKAYQSSLCYKLSQAIDNKRREFHTLYHRNQGKRILTATNTAVVKKPELVARPQQDVTVNAKENGKSDLPPAIEVQKSVPSQCSKEGSQIIMASVPMGETKIIKGHELKSVLSQALITTKALNEPHSIVRPTLIINSATNTITNCSNVATLARGVPFAAQIKMVPRLVSSLDGLQPQASPHGATISPMITKVLNATAGTQRLLASARPLSATVTRPMTTPILRPASAPRSIIVTSRPGNVRSGSLINVSSLANPFIGPVITSVKGKVTTTSSTTNNMSLRLTGNTIQVPVMPNGTATTGNGNVVLTYRLKDNRLLPLVPLKSASGIPVYKIAHKLNGNEITAKPNGS